MNYAAKQHDAAIDYQLNSIRSDNVAKTIRFFQKEELQALAEHCGVSKWGTKHEIALRIQKHRRGFSALGCTAPGLDRAECRLGGVCKCKPKGKQA